MTVCAGGFLFKNDRWLFGKRSKNKDWAPGLWDIIGGHSKKHEEPVNTLKREAYEEVGVLVHDAVLLKVIDIPDNSKDGYFKYYIYLINSWDIEPANLSDEHTEIAWFTRSELEHVSLALPVYTSLLDEWVAKNCFQK